VLAILNAVKVGNELINFMNDNKQSLSKGLKTLASISSAATFGLPFACLALDLFLGSQPNPELEAIKREIS
jgi:hypothetical protein